MNQLDKLIKTISKLPGLGPRSGRRIALHLLKNKQDIMLPLANLIQDVASTVKTCSNCGNLDLTPTCNICNDDNRDHSIICVVEEVADLWALERGNMYKGVYHVLGGALSAVDGITADKLNFTGLLEHIKKGGVTEIILATNATIAGQTTAYYITDLLNEFDIKITRPAQGIPFGGELDYLDEGTLSSALQKRLEFS